MKSTRVLRPESSVQLLRPESRDSGMPRFSSLQTNGSMVLQILEAALQGVLRKRCSENMQQIYGIHS